MSILNADWSLPPNVPFLSPDFNVGASHASSMNQGMNPVMSPHTAAQQHQWNPSDQFAPSNPPLNHFNVPSANTAGYPNSARLTGPMQHAQSSDAALNNRGTFPSFGTQVTGGR